MAGNDGFLQDFTDAVGSWQNATTVFIHNPQLLMMGSAYLAPCPGKFWTICATLPANEPLD
ncbi:MAG: hypothetical protein CL912_32120 [Deltaproteobacteria bacterium]|nr:hypothetical protein [Deltaproteobacteria bacterium]